MKRLNGKWSVFLCFAVLLGIAHFNLYFSLPSHLWRIYFHSNTTRLSNNNTMITTNTTIDQQLDIIITSPSPPPPNPINSTTTSTNSTTQEYFLIIAIPERSWDRFRTEMRQTWLQYNNIYHPTLRPHGTTRYFFILGEQGLDNVELTGARMENEEYGDMLFFPDMGNHDASGKFMRFCQWLNNENESGISSYHYLFKTDSDSFVRTEILEEDLRLQAAKTNPLLDHVFMGFPMHVQINNCGFKQGIDLMIGCGYVLSRALVSFVAYSPLIPDKHRWCTDREDVRTGMWVSYAGKKEVKRMPLKGITSSPHNPGSTVLNHPVVLHLAMLKDYVPILFPLFWKHWPPGSAGEDPAFDWKPLMDVINELRSRPVPNPSPKHAQLAQWRKKVKVLIHNRTHLPH